MNVHLCFYKKVIQLHVLRTYFCKMSIGESKGTNFFNKGKYEGQHTVWLTLLNIVC